MHKGIEARRSTWIRDQERHAATMAFSIGDAVRLNRRCADPFRGRIATITGRDRDMLRLKFEGEARVLWVDPRMVKMEAAGYLA